MEMSQHDLEKFLTLVYKAIGGQSSVAKKLPVLCYFETLCNDSTLANLLVNSSLMKLFVKMLRTYNSPSLKCKLCSVMGLLIRHATYISSDISYVIIFVN